MDFVSILIGLAVLGFWIACAVFVFYITMMLFFGIVGGVIMAVVWVGGKIVEAIKGVVDDRQ